MWNSYRRKKPKSDRKKLVAKLDDVVREIVRIRDQFTCRRCGLIISDKRVATTSHFFNAVRYSTRWNLDNVDLLCLGCHRLVENDKDKTLEIRKGSKTFWNYREWKISQLGEEAFTSLYIKSQTSIKYTMEDLEEMYNELRKKVVHG